jgi:hypothetical protein
MFEYKQGDIVRCKIFYKGEYTHLNLYSGSEYVISAIYGLTSPNKFFMVRISGTNFTKLEFHKTFYSKKEIRQLKLKKINRNVNS